MDYSACDGSFIPEAVAAVFDANAWHSRAYPGPSYEERCLQLAQKRAAECKTAEQRRIVERRSDPSMHASTIGRHQK